MKKILYYYNFLFVSACYFSQKVRAKGEPYEMAYWWISFLIGVNLTSMLMLIRHFIGFEIRMGKVLFVFIFFLPPFILNYFIFLRKKRYQKLLKGIATKSIVFIIYMLFTFMFYVITGYINIP